MPQEIYNEGRVVGLSAWELFYKEAVGNGMDPEQVPDEHEWLTSMLGSGASMILKISAGTTAGVHDYILPAGSGLTAAGVIVANPFLGQCTWDVSGWAKKVESYGGLIENNALAHPPISGMNTVPYNPHYNAADFRREVSEFVKVTDGIVFTKNANWPDAASTPPEKDIQPNFSSSSTVVRLNMHTAIERDFAILFTGFTNKSLLLCYDIASGGSSTNMDANNWKNGGMIGPYTVPWASKIVFTVPNTAFNFPATLERTIPAGISTDTATIGDYEFSNMLRESIPTDSYIDFNSININDYYVNHSEDFVGEPTLLENITDMELGTAECYNTIVAWYPGISATRISSPSTTEDMIFPPALYGIHITETGSSQTLVPLDVAAPGTIKGFRDLDAAKQYSKLLKDNYAIYYNTSTNSYSFVNGNNVYPINSKLEYLTAPRVRLTVGDTAAKFVALSDSNGTDYNTAGGNGSISTKGAREFKWDDVLAGLAQGKTVNILGDRLTAFASELATSTYGTVGLTASNQISEIGATRLTVSPQSNPVTITSTSGLGDVKMATAGTGTTYKAGTNFIEFSNGLRLYISTQAPTTNVPVGSIGIGW